MECSSPSSTRSSQGSSPRTAIPALRSGLRRRGQKSSSAPLEHRMFLMDKRQKKKDVATMKSRTVHGTILREVNVGKKHVDASSMLRMEHLQKLARWASVEAGIQPLGALFGHRLAASAEAEGVPLNPSTFICHKCESILQPGFNCTVRVEKNRKKAKRHKRSRIPSQNNVVYRCYFCCHSNLLRGTPRGHVKGLLPSKPKPQVSSSEPLGNSEKGLKDEKKLGQNTEQRITSAAEPVVEPSKADAVAGDISLEKSPLTLLERLASSSKKKRKRSTSAGNKDPNSVHDSATLPTLESTAGSSKRKRKGWSSLRKIAESSEAQISWSFSNLAIPFLLQTSK